MNDDYLWDKSGEPDPQVQQLEEILGTLRYQQRPLKVPSQSVVGRRPSYFPMLAIAATVALTLVAAGLWLRSQSQKAHRPQEVTIVVPGGIKKDVPTPIIPREEGTVQKPKDTAKAPRLNPRNLIAGNVRRVKASPEAGLTKEDRAEALAAKEQLMVALRLASEKLNLAQRRTQSSSPPNLIRNQHKVG